MENTTAVHYDTRATRAHQGGAALKAAASVEPTRLEECVAVAMAAADRIERLADLAHDLADSRLGPQPPRVADVPDSADRASKASAPAGVVNLRVISQLDWLSAELDRLRAL